MTSPDTVKPATAIAVNGLRDDRLASTPQPERPFQMTSLDNNHPRNEASDPLDLANLRLNQSFTETAGVKKLLKTVPVRKPTPQDWVRVHPDPEMRANFPLIELKDEREEYVIAGPLVTALVGEFVSKTLYTTINRQGVVSLWPVRLPDPGGREMEWSDQHAKRPNSQWAAGSAARRTVVSALMRYSRRKVALPIPPGRTSPFKRLFASRFGTG